MDLGCGLQNRNTLYKGYHVQMISFSCIYSFQMKLTRIAHQSLWVVLVNIVSLEKDLRYIPDCIHPLLPLGLQDIVSLLQTAFL